jgi:hypothetical protein
MTKKIHVLLLFLLLGTFGSCRNEDLNPVPDWEPGVHGYGVFAAKESRAGYTANFPVADQLNSKIDYKIRWVSLDNKLSVSKIELYVSFLESYLDADKNARTVSHGTELLKTLDASGNRVWTDFSVSGAEVYELFKDAKFKYDGATETPVFANPLRTAGAPFLAKRQDPDPNVPAEKKLAVNADEFVLTWRLYTPDGGVFKSWSVSVCEEISNAGEGNSNCELVWSVR